MCQAHSVSSCKPSRLSLQLQLLGAMDNQSLCFTEMTGIHGRALLPLQVIYLCGTGK